MKPFDLLLLILAAFLMALGMRPASAAGAGTGALLQKQTQELVDAVTHGKAERLQPEVADSFFVAGDPRIREIFQRDGRGQITGFVERRESWDILWSRQP